MKSITYFVANLYRISSKSYVNARPVDHF